MLHHAFAPRPRPLLPARQLQAWAWPLAACLCLTSLVAAREPLAYYAQAISGHLRVMQAARPVAEILAQAPAPLATQLRTAQAARAFAAQQLALPHNASYTRYAALERQSVVWNVVAAPALSLKPKHWCFAFMGCVSYRGYYAQHAAEQEAARLKALGWEVTVYGVPAYSTLGYLNWAGGDPLLSTFIAWPEGDMARLIFHELAHQVLYVRDDSTFNESFATAVEKAGVRRWLSTRSAQAQADYAALEAWRSAFAQLTRSTRAQLARVYDNAALTQAEKTAQKATIYAQFRAAYAKLKTRHPAPPQGFAAYDAWVARANNARFAGLSTYDELVPQFNAALAANGHDLAAFYRAIQRITPLPKTARRTALAALGAPTAQP